MPRERRGRLQRCRRATVDDHGLRGVNHECREPRPAPRHLVEGTHGVARHSLRQLVPLGRRPLHAVRLLRVRALRGAGRHKTGEGARSGAPAARSVAADHPALVYSGYYHKYVTDDHATFHREWSTWVSKFENFGQAARENPGVALRCRDQRAASRRRRLSTRTCARRRARGGRAASTAKSATASARCAPSSTASSCTTSRARIAPSGTRAT